MNIAQNPNSELSHFAVNTPQVFEIPETFRETARQFQEAMMQYSCAIREFKTKLEVLNDEFQVQRSHNPISYIKYRVKKPASILLMEVWKRVKKISLKMNMKKRL